MRRFILSVVITLFAISIKAQCSANYTYSNIGGGVVNFTSTSIGTSSVTAYNWYFGVGNGVLQQSVGIGTTSFSFPYNGIFNVNLTIYDSLSQCSSSVAMNLTVTNVPCNGNVSFTSQQGQNGTRIFNNTSGGLPQNATWNWSFGDGGTSNSYSPSHTYTAAGNYSVVLTGTDQVGICSYSTVQNVSVAIMNCSLTSAFSFTQGMNGNVSFSSLATGTTNTTNYYWMFGDGNTSGQPNPVNTYTSNGSYVVTLLVQDSIMFNCSSSSTMALNYTTCIANVNFGMQKDSTQLPAIVWNAIPNYPQNIVAANWFWGDGSNTVGLYPTHTYSAAGLYSICVTITVSCGATASMCYNTNIFKTANPEQFAIAKVQVIAAPTGIAERNEEAYQIKLYPNPNNGEFILELPQEKGSLCKLDIYSLLGARVYSCTIEENAGIKTINQNDLPEGSYFIKVESGSKSSYKKFVIVK